MGYHDTLERVQAKIGVFVNLHQSSGFKAKEGWAPVVGGMKSVCEITHTHTHT